MSSADDAKLPVDVRELVVKRAERLAADATHADAEYELAIKTAKEAVEAYKLAENSVVATTEAVFVAQEKKNKAQSAATRAAKEVSEIEGWYDTFVKLKENAIRNDMCAGCGDMSRGGCIMFGSCGGPPGGPPQVD